jgi:hypothetical protein
MKKIYLLLSLCFSVSLGSVAQNLLTNPGFEDGLSTWDTGAWGGAVATYTSSSEFKQEGQKSAKIEVASAYADDPGRAYVRKNGLQIEQNVPHKLEFYILSNSGLSESIIISMYSHTNIGGNAWGNAYSNGDVSFVGDGQWHKISLEFTPTNVEGTPDFSSLGLLFGFAKNTGTFYLDSLSLVSDNEITGGALHVSKTGNDTNSGTLEMPFLSLSKAAELAKGGDTVYIHEGTYEETLSPQNSGLPGYPVVYTAYNNEKVIISAMQSLNAWQADEGNIFKTGVNWTLGQDNFVMYKTTALDLARWPNNTDGDVFTPNSKRNTGGSDGDVITNAYLTQAKFQITIGKMAVLFGFMATDPEPVGQPGKLL